VLFALGLLAIGALIGVGQRPRPAVPASGRAAASTAHLDRAARQVLEELVAIDTTVSTGSATRAAEAIRARLLAAGFAADDLVIAGPGGRKQNLVARYRGTGQAPPLLLLAHVDVVDARREDWSVDPFTLVERGGFLYGRGTVDMKDMAAAFVANMAGLKEAGYRPVRDVILAATADEEGGDANGVEWLLRNRPGLIEASLCLTEGGGGQIHDGRYAAYLVQASEKVSATFSIEARGPGGHSAVPGRENAVYRLAAALSRLAAFQFPVALNDVTRAFFARMAPVEGGSLGRDMSALVGGAIPDADAARRLSRHPYYNALLRTTCVATNVEAGGAENALPARATAMVNCRLLPGARVEDVRRALEHAVADASVAVAVVGSTSAAPPSPAGGEAEAAVEAVVREMWPGVPVMVSMGTATTDGRFLRAAGVPTYGLGPFRNVEDNRAHAPDERIGVRQFYEEREFLLRVIRKLAGGGE
jgi:acetylornithine deacetylase/succinyl-diaminopimelate desuccinylase-like protein